MLCKCFVVQEICIENIFKLYILGDWECLYVIVKHTMLLHREYTLDVYRMTSIVTEVCTYMCVYMHVCVHVCVCVCVMDSQNDLFFKKL